MPVTPTPLSNEHRYATALQQAHGLANCIAQQLQELLKNQTSAVLAVSGGKSPIAMLTALRAAPLDWERVVVTVVDERVVPAHHPDSNTQLVRTHLLQDAASAAQFIGWFDDIDNPQVLSPEALARHANARLGNQIKRLDIAVLGMGDDGHTASWFPNSPGLQAAMQTTEWITWVRPIAAPHLRLTLTRHVILQAKQLHLAIAGTNKIQVYERAKHAPSDALPVSSVLHNHPAHQVWIAESNL